MTTYVIAAAIAIAVVALSLPRTISNPTWRAMVTPLASIIGSGFLVLGPILLVSYGALAPVAMACLIALAWLFGSAIRFNIKRIGDGTDSRTATELRLEHISSWLLAFAYVISIAYYLNLFGTFAVSLTDYNTAQSARVVSTAVYLAILFIGCLKGFKAFETAEVVSVTLKLAIIFGLLTGLFLYFTSQAREGLLSGDIPEISWNNATLLLLGLIVAVQGFETSRYMGANYSSAIRTQSMQFSQLLSGLIYMVYVVLLTFAFDQYSINLTEASIVEMMTVVSPVLPAVLVLGALTAQFSAAVADTVGSGGLFSELSHRQIPMPFIYLLLVVTGIALTWAANVFELIALASRAFALYYAAQSAIAAVGAFASKQTRHALVFTGLAGMGIITAVFSKTLHVT